MGGFFHEFFTRPLFNALVFLYQTAAVEDLGIAIILLTLTIRLILYPLFYKSYKNQTLLQKIQPEIKKIQHDHKNNRERQAQEMLALYKQHKVNPFSSFFLLLVQLPILIALYRVFLRGFNGEALTDLYSFVAAPSDFNNSLLGLINLAEPHIIIVGLAAAAQYFQGKLSLAKTPRNQGASGAERITRQMVFIGPALTLVILYSLPSAVGLYWLTTSIFSLVQQIFINRSLKKNGTITDPNQKTT